MDTNKPKKTKVKRKEDKLWSEFKDFEKKDPRYKQYDGHKAIPFSFELGFVTVLVEPTVQENIAMHWRQTDTTHRSKDVFLILSVTFCIAKKHLTAKL